MAIGPSRHPMNDPKIPETQQHLTRIEWNDQTISLLKDQRPRSSQGMEPQQENTQEPYHAGIALALTFAECLLVAS